MSPIVDAQVHRILVMYHTSWLAWGEAPLEHLPSLEGQRNDDVIFESDRALLFFGRIYSGSISVQVSARKEPADWLALEWQQTFVRRLHLYGELGLGSLDTSMSDMPLLGAIDDGMYEVTVRMWSDPDEDEDETFDSTERVWVHIDPVPS